jgi:hypothetical protein
MRPSLTANTEPISSNNSVIFSNLSMMRQINSKILARFPPNHALFTSRQPDVFSAVISALNLLDRCFALPHPVRSAQGYIFGLIILALAEFNFAVDYRLIF